MYRSSYSGGLRMPELGRLDRVIYGLGITVLAGLGALMIPVFLIFENRVPFADQAIVAYSNRAGILGFFLSFLLMGLVVWAFAGGRFRKFPIFGVSGVAYGEPEWNPVYPLLMSTRNQPEHVKRAVWEGRQLVYIFTVTALAAVLIFGISLLSGNRLCSDGSIRWIWGFGWEAECFVPEEVEQVTVRNQLVGSNRGISSRRYEITVEFRTEDDRIHSFLLRDFRKDGELSQVGFLAQVLDCYQDADLTFLNGEHLNDLIRDQQYSAEDQVILLELFGVG